MPSKFRLDSFRSRIFRVLGDENRLRIIEALFDEPKNVTQISEALGADQSLVSHHLRALREEGLVLSTRFGKEAIYSLSEDIKGKKRPNHLELGCCQIVLKNKKAQS